ncbi:MAG: hypothetical protein JNL74_22475, partial [Fibrobacteres bacterium]|nr:hypothetical protein [Fibrobacterota bacterium]
ALQQTEDSAERENRLKILAFSYILNGNRKLAEDVFNRMLNANSGFTLDPILTSPKIYEVFSEVRQQWLMSYNSLEKEKRLTLRYRAAYHARVLPFGTGQFINGSRKKGLIFSLLQAGAIGGSIWSYKMLDASKHPDYGWYDGNREEKERYTNLTRVQFGIFASAYIWSVIDAYMEANE